MSDYTWRDAVGVLADVLPKDLKSEEILWCSNSGWSYDDYRAMKRLGVDPRDHESPIAAFSEALLQPEVVEAAGRALVEQSETGMASEDEATIALTAALAAMTETKEGQGDE